jgi:hypothetical protein
MRRLHLAIALATLSCGPDFDRSISLIPADTVLAVKAEPPESLPGGTVAYTALAATSAGADASAQMVWSFCTTAPAPTDDSPVSASCVAGESDSSAVGTSVTLPTPSDACRRFGPLGMPAQAGQAPSRPTPPDVTGGYYQPIRLGWDASVSIVRERLTCDPTGISLDLAQAYRAAHKPNSNPHLLPIGATVAGQPVDLAVVPPLATVDLLATWPADSAEEYLTVAPERAALDPHVEKLWVAWFGTGGSLDSDVSQAAPSGNAAGNRFHAPASAGTYYLWTVLHDDRGGIDFAQTEIVVR